MVISWLHEEFPERMPDAMAATVILQHGGFPNPVTAMAVVIGESGVPDQPFVRRTVSPVVTAQPPNPAAGSRDLGMWQLNSFWHPVGEAVAYDPVKATGYAYRISGNGTDFDSWVAFTNGRYLQFMARARVAIDTARTFVIIK